MNTRKYKLVLITLFAAIACVCFCAIKHYNNTRILNIDFYMSYRYDKNVCNVKVNGKFTNASDVLMETVTGFYTWDQLPLTDNFKAKYANRNNIISIDTRVNKISNFYITQSNENLIELKLHRKNIDIINSVFFNTDTIYTFRYKVVDDKLDDIELIDKYEVDALTGERVGGKVEENKV